MAYDNDEILFDFFAFFPGLLAADGEQLVDLTGVIDVVVGNQAHDIQ